MTTKRKTRKTQRQIAHPSAKFKQFYPYLKLLYKSKGKIRKDLLANSTNNQLKALQTICKNLKGGGIVLTPTKKRKLARFKSTIRFLASPKNSQKRKRRVLVQSGSGFFIPALLGSIIPLISNLVTGGR